MLERTEHTRLLNCSLTVLSTEASRPLLLRGFENHPREWSPNISPKCCKRQPSGRKGCLCVTLSFIRNTLAGWTLSFFHETLCTAGVEESESDQKRKNIKTHVIWWLWLIVWVESEASFGELLRTDGGHIVHGIKAWHKWMGTRWRTWGLGISVI